ncbi:MAG TPA: VanZ family protein [Stenomitos sp.]
MKEIPAVQRVVLVCVWLAWMGLIFFFSTQQWKSTQTELWLNWLLTQYLPSVRDLLSATDLSQLNFVIRKLAHFTEYAILTVLGYWGWVRGVKLLPAQAIRFALFWSIMFAISDEFHQRFEPGRTSLITDVLIDSIGASVAALTVQQVLLHSSSLPKQS